MKSLKRNTGSQFITAAAAVGLLLPGISGAATSPGFQKALKSYEAGFYRQALTELTRAEKSAGTEAAKIAYLKGSCLEKLQQYEEAAKSFEKASRLGVEVADVDFEQGQASYAARNLEEAAKAFEKSKTKGFKPATSTYYLGYIDQVQEKHDQALGRYGEILAAQDDPESVKQAAAFQGAEIRLVKAEALEPLDRKKEVLLAEVIPNYERAADFASDSPIAAQSLARIGQIRQRHFPYSRKPWSLSVGQEVRYDSNVVTEADQAVTQLSNTGSLISDTTAGGSYSFAAGNWSITPRAHLTALVHARRDVGRVFQNDSIDIAPGVSGGTPHKLFGKDAVLTLDYAMDYYLRDYTQTHRFSFFQLSHLVSVSEQLPLFGFGPTSVRVGYKTLRSEDVGYSGNTPSFGITQSADLGKGVAGTSSLSADFLTAQDRQNDLFTYGWSNTVHVPRLQWGIDVRPTFGISLVDTRNQTAVRGTETLLDAGLGFSKYWESGVSVDLDYAFSRRNSKDVANYAYSKHAVGMGIKYSL